MPSRRSFLRQMLRVLAGGGALLVSSLAVVPRGWAKLKRVVLPPGTVATKLQHRVPRELDTRHLSVTPLDKFGTMGQTDVALDPKTWRLEVKGAVNKPLRLTYDQLLKTPPVEKKVLLICPGVFSYHAEWRGVSLGRLLRMAGVEPGAASVVIKGPPGRTATTKTFSSEEIERGDVFLATHVNGRPLPRKHGFPLLVVARDHYGYDWVKYVSSITVQPAPARAAR